MLLLDDMALLDQHLDQSDTNFSSLPLLAAALDQNPTRFSPETHTLVQTLLSGQFEIAPVDPS